MEEVKVLQRVQTLNIKKLLLLLLLGVRKLLVTFFSLTPALMAVIVVLVLFNPRKNELREEERVEDAIMERKDP